MKLLLRVAIVVSIALYAHSQQPLDADANARITQLEIQVAQLSKAVTLEAKIIKTQDHQIDELTQRLTQAEDDIKNNQSEFYSWTTAIDGRMEAIEKWHGKEPNEVSQ